MTTHNGIPSTQKLPAPTLAPKSVAPPQGRTQRVKRERLGGTLDMAAIKALRGSK
jgi:hypothetical protein